MNNGGKSNNRTVRKSGEVHQMNHNINLVELLNDSMLKAPLATVESYNPSPRSLERKDSSPYGSGHPVWIRRQTDISVENKQTITTTMFPFVIVGRCLGLVATKKSKISYIPLYFFCLTISFAIVRTLMLFTNIESFDGTFVSILIMLIHYSKCLCALYYLRRLLGPASSNFYGLWEDVVEGAHRCPESKRHIKKWVTTGVWFAVLGTTISSAIITLGSMRLGFDLPGIESILVYPNLISLNGLFMFITSTFDFMLQAMYMVLCMAIYFEFDNLLRKLSLIVMLTNYDFEYQLKIFRLHHYQLIDLTDQLDSLISYYAFIIIAGNLPVLCCLLYVLGNVKVTFGTKLSLGFWIVKLIGETLLASLAPSTISYIVICFKHLRFSTHRSLCSQLGGHTWLLHC